jgi:hypothetical protein
LPRDANEVSKISAQCKSMFEVTDIVATQALGREPSQTREGFIRFLSYYKYTEPYIKFNL